MEADISIWRKTGHFYFALTGEVSPIFALVASPGLQHNAPVLVLVTLQSAE
jgi:hypothetical protein